MRALIPTLPPGQPDPAWLRRLLILQRICLGLVSLIALATIFVWLLPPFIESLWPIVSNVSPALAVTILACVLALALSDPGNTALVRLFARYFAAVPLLLALLLLLASVYPLSPTPSFLQQLGQAGAEPGAQSPQAAAAFVLLAVVMILVRTDSTSARHASDVLVSCLSLVALILVSQDIFGALGLFGITAPDLLAPRVLLTFVLLTLVVTLRQAEFGIFSIFLGGGIGSRIARGFAPVLLLWPFLREIGEAQIGFPKLIPSHFAPSVLTSLAVAFALVLLLSIVWRINEMEKEIHDLTLRDELTGLYNMGGFYLLAEQTQRLAQRAKLPFSVLFLDLDGLKQINDHLGHNAGSAYLAETGQILQANFRTSDVKGRFGGDEFVVAGQFSAVAIELAVTRLRAAAAEKNKHPGRRYPLSFSIGHVTVEYYSTETLRQLVAKADELMYEDKRQRKMARG